MYISYSFIYKNTERCEREDRMMERKKNCKQKVKVHDSESLKRIVLESSIMHAGKWQRKRVLLCCGFQSDCLTIAEWLSKLSLEVVQNGGSMHLRLI